MVDSIEEIVHTTQTMVLILTSRVNENLFVKIHEMPTISPLIINPIITTVTVVNGTLIIIGKSCPFGPNTAAIAPIKAVINIPMK
jgi:hypothetical protein